MNIGGCTRNPVSFLLLHRMFRGVSGRVWPPSAPNWLVPLHEHVPQRLKHQTQLLLGDFCFSLSFFSDASTAPCQVCVEDFEADLWCAVKAWKTGREKLNPKKDKSFLFFFFSTAHDGRCIMSSSGRHKKLQLLFRQQNSLRCFVRYPAFIHSRVWKWFYKLLRDAELALSSLHFYPRRTLYSDEEMEGKQNITKQNCSNPTESLFPVWLRYKIVGFQQTAEAL